MAKPIRIVVKGSDCLGNDAPTVDDLFSQILDQVDILREVEDAIAGEGSEQLVWRVTSVSKNSPIMFEITPFPKIYGTDIENRAAQVVKATAQGFHKLNEGNVRPSHFTDKVLNKIVGVNERIMNGLAATEIDFSGYEGAPSWSLSRKTARSTIKRIDRLKSPPMKPHRELGSVEGFVKTVGRDGHGRSKITLTTRLDRKDVKCASARGEQGLDEIDHLKVGKVTKGLRIRVHGVLHFKASNVLDRVDVERVELFPFLEDLPSVEDLIDPEFTDGLTSVEFIRRARDDGKSG